MTQGVDSNTNAAVFSMGLILISFILNLCSSLFTYKYRKMYLLGFFGWIIVSIKTSCTIFFHVYHILFTQIIDDVFLLILSVFMFLLAIKLFKSGSV
ncbi:hypothetical protein PSDVSF_16990 [Pseudodesulfovibrio sediminis]|uniref:Uncharacterized protein n=1 Tax=Pseudodesulfovibrio sediminis TaxID=2810563 RepID=A0ABN6ESR4_9BACT|nr:hypothetical protein PSDVSF_16990 [Pseudodesulfovibrio sediminis]